MASLGTFMEDRDLLSCMFKRPRKAFSYSVGYVGSVKLSLPGQISK